MSSAKIKLSGATVERKHKGGFTATIPYQFNGETRKQYIKVWTSEQVTEGDLLDITGEPSARLSEYTDKQGTLKTVAELHINNPVITGNEPAF